jgi:EAL domain-containing protein (putative c-di-GMP-specific phosphodiesterase class I)
MVEAINNIGHVMGIQTIAEFVEDNVIRDELKKINVNFAQGYGIGRPEPLEQAFSFAGF